MQNFDFLPRAQDTTPDLSEPFWDSSQPSNPNLHQLRQVFEQGNGIGFQPARLVKARAGSRQQQFFSRYTALRPLLCFCQNYAQGRIALACCPGFGSGNDNYPSSLEKGGDYVLVATHFRALSLVFVRVDAESSLIVT